MRRAGKTLVCRICNQVVGHKHINSIKVHVNSQSHKDKENGPKQKSLLEVSQSLPTHKKEYYKKLAEIHIKNDIPLHKLGKKAFREFLEKYIPIPLPEESTLRKGYVHLVYADKIEEIRACS